MKIKRFSKVLNPKYQVLSLTRPESIDGKRLDQNLGKFSNEEIRGSLTKEMRKFEEEKRNFALGSGNNVKDSKNNKISNNNNFGHEIGELSKEKRRIKLV